MTKSYRVYFNRRDPKGCIWSVDEGTIASEIHVQAFNLAGVNAYTQSNVDAAEGEPSGYLVVDGAEMEIMAGYAIFRPQSSEKAGA